MTRASVQFSSVQSLSCVRLFVTPWTAARHASLSITNSRSSLAYLLENSSRTSGLKTLSSTRISCRSFSSTNRQMILWPRKPPPPVTRQLHPAMPNLSTEKHSPGTRKHWGTVWARGRCWREPQREFKWFHAHKDTLCSFYSIFAKIPCAHLPGVAERKWKSSNRSDCGKPDGSTRVLISRSPKDGTGESFICCCLWLSPLSLEFLQCTHCSHLLTSSPNSSDLYLVALIPLRHRRREQASRPQRDKDSWFYPQQGSWQSVSAGIHRLWTETGRGEISNNVNCCLVQQRHLEGVGVRWIHGSLLSRLSECSLKCCCFAEFKV